MFWLGLFGVIMTAIGGLIGIPLVRAWIRCMTHKELDRLCDVLRIIFIIIGAPIAIGTLISSYYNLTSTRQSLQNNRQELSDTKHELENTRGQLNTMVEEKQKLETIKRTLPIIKADLLISQDKKFHIIITSLNLVPFECKWKVLNRNDTYVNTVIQFDWQKIYPEHNKVYR